MIVSEATLKVLKSFAGINSSIYVKPGKVLRTMKEDWSVIAEITVPDEFPKEFGIYDLPEFVANLSAMESPELSFGNEKFLLIQDGSLKLKYQFCSPELISSPPDEEMSFSEPSATFALNKTEMDKMLKIAGLNGLPMLSIVGKKGKLSAKTHQTANVAGNEATMELGNYDGQDFSVTFKVENLCMEPDDYTVNIMTANEQTPVSRFTNKAGTAKYFIAIES